MPKFAHALLQTARTIAYRWLPYSCHQGLHLLRYYLFTPAAEQEAWKERTRSILDAPDSLTIPRVPEAGTVRDGLLTMHNGIRVLANSYFGIPGRKLFEVTRGIHEPQEEKVFGAVLPALSKGATMVELGAYWGFYSLWFQRDVMQGRCYLLEADERNLDYGRKNFAINSVPAQFFHTYVGARSGWAEDGTPIVSIDEFIVAQKLARIDLLHCDIQGHELSMLEGAVESLAAKCIGYLFISTHSETLHRQCADFLGDRGYEMFASVTPSESFSVDGILVARVPGLAGPERVDLAKKPAAD